MLQAYFPLVALIAAYVAAEPVARLIPVSRTQGDRRILITGILAAVIAYVFLGLLRAWPAAILMGIVAATASALSPDRGASGWLWLRIIVLLVIAGIGAWLVPSPFSDGRGFFWPADWYRTLLVLAGAYITIEWGGGWVERAIKPFAASVTFYEGEDQGLPNGGRMIGRLERLLIYLFVLIGSPTAIGFLVTAKSILRFGEIKDKESHRLAEYIIIGTLMSFGFAIVVAYLVAEVLA